MLDKDRIESVTDLGKRFSDATIQLHEAIAQKAGLTGADHKYLNYLIRTGPVTAGELARLAGLTTGAVTGVIDRLEEKGLVKREFIEQDRRKVIIVPDLEKTQSLLAPSFQLLKEKVLNLVEKLTDEEIIVVENYLNNAITVLKEVTSDLRSDIK